MAYQIIQFVEDRFYQICKISDIKEENGTIYGSYKGCFYPAIICNEGCKYVYNSGFYTVLLNFISDKFA